VSKYNDLTGNKYGRLTVIEYLGKNKQYDSIWRCICDCGTEITVRAGVLLNGHTQSCGCLQISRTRESHITHGLSRDENGKRTKLYHVWDGLKQRCYNPKSPFYSYYGGKGIVLCDEWLNYKAFHAWAMSHGYKDGLSIERERINGIYEPDNCSWIPKSHQARNRSMSVVVEYNGEIKNLSDWCDLLGKNKKMLGQRLRRGWSVEKTFTT